MLLSLLIAFAQVPQPAESEPIVVTGHPLSSLRDDLAECIARRCPPREDIVASLRYAEGLFRTGDYQGARNILGRAVSRNRRFAAAEPVAVANLYVAQSRVARHYGDQRLQADATHAAATVLREHGTPEMPDSLLAEMSVADLMATRGDAEGAERSYAQLFETAERAGQRGIAFTLGLRRAWLADRRGRLPEARRLLSELLQAQGSDLESYRLAARVLALRMARKDNDEAAVDALLADVERQPQPAPVLLSAPAIPQPAREGVGVDELDLTGSVRSMEFRPLLWADIGFWVGSDGRVEDVEVLRGSNSLGWTEPVRAAIAGRRYTPFLAGSGAPGVYRVERYTLTADFETPAGSHIRRRAGRARIEQIALSGIPPRSLASE